MSNIGKTSNRPDTLYFAYGSNMSEERIHARCPDVSFFSIAELPNHRLEVPRVSKGLNCGVAGVTPDLNDSVFGVLYKVTEDDLITLDRFEGVKVGAYFRKQIDVLLPDGNQVEATIYQSNPMPETKLPSEEYLGHLIQGAQEHNLPQEYIDRLKSFPTL
jgi:gamma-glutamylcyclotransferase (GGCT)/AIG2-like uncharacterized protein YtfP